MTSEPTDEEYEEMQRAYDRSAVSAADREKAWEAAQDHPEYMRLTSVLESLTGMITGYEEHEFSKLQLGQMTAWMRHKWHIDRDSLMVLISEMLSDALSKAKTDDIQALRIQTIENNLGQEYAKSMLLAFLAGMLYHQRNTTLVEDLVAGAKNKGKEANA